MTPKWFLLLVLLSLTACSHFTTAPNLSTTAIPPYSPTATSSPTPNAPLASVIVTATPKPFATWTSDGKASVESAGLLILTWELPAPPEIDPLKFYTKDLVSHTLQDIQQGELFAPSERGIIDSGIGFWATLGKDKLVATYDEKNWVTVTRNGQEIYKISTGDVSPVTPLQTLWVYDNHWVLETNFYIKGKPFHGHLTEDGILLNEKYGYEEAFGFQTIDGQPFYLFKKDGKINAWYAGQEIHLRFDQVPHYNCCSAFELNPRQWTNMVIFFGVRGKTWYFVQIGTPDALK